MEGMICYQPVLHAWLGKNMMVLPRHVSQANHHAETNFPYYDRKGRTIEQLKSNIFTGKLAEIVVHHYLSHWFKNGPDMDCSNRRSDDGFDFIFKEPLEGIVYDWSFSKQKFNTKKTFAVKSSLLDIKCSVSKHGGSNIEEYQQAEFPSDARKLMLRKEVWNGEAPYYLIVNFDENLMSMRIISYMHSSELALRPAGLLREKWVGEQNNSQKLFMTAQDMRYKVEDCELIKNNEMLDDTKEVDV